MNKSEIIPDRLYTPAQVASVFSVDAKTVTRWVKGNKFHDEEYLRTAGNHHRIFGHGILRLLGKRPEGASGA